jgi:hypothetical protein
VAKSTEHKMLFDIRGRRKRVIQVVYVMLALLMALSLFTVVGPVNLGDLVGGGSSSSSSASDDQAQAIERKLAKDSRNEALLLSDVRARSTFARAQIQTDPTTGAQSGITEEGLQSFQKAGDAWIRYMKLDPKKPDAIVAQLAATSLLYSSNLTDLDTRVKSAADAQAVYAQAQPSAAAYLTLAQLRFLTGDPKGGQQAGQKAKQEAPAAQRKIVTQTVDQYAKQSAQLRKEAKQQSKLSPSGGGKQALQNPFGGLSGGGTGTGTIP